MAVASNSEFSTNTEISAAEKLQHGSVSPFELMTRASDQLPVQPPDEQALMGALASAVFEPEAFAASMDAIGHTVYACDFQWNRQLSVMTIYPGCLKSFDQDEMLGRLRQYHQDSNGHGKLINTSSRAEGSTEPVGA
jgi:hypothetical protein